ncbi:MAG: DUF4956 domain-containing protein [Gammaproteobacteria bacterium]|jgi:hypothetical protein|nr:DUF4956 domain-containing protein [Gammaproteobacteria bacterium]
MRKSVRVSAPLFVITAFYAACLALYFLLIDILPGLARYLPVGGIQDMVASGGVELEVITSGGNPVGGAPYVWQLAMAVVCAAILMTPVSWMYFITTPRKKVDRAFAQTMIILPIIVAGIATIVQDSIALAFSLAGIVAAVRFRFTLSESAHTLYIFCAIAVGLAAGISAIGIALVVSVAFVYGTLLLWTLDYGARLNNTFFAFLTSRDHEDDEL